MVDVAIIRASYDGVPESMRKLLEPLGGMKHFVSPGQKVLLKANLLGSFPVSKAVTTNPAVVRAAVALVKEAGGIPYLGDSPGMGTLEQAMKSGGLYDLVESGEVLLADFENEDVYERLENRISKRLVLARAVKEADVIISLPKMKTHVQMAYTGALKNQYGLLVGVRKSNYHLRLRDNGLLGELVVEINRTAKVNLAIMDGIVAMEGDGPSGGRPREVGLLFASPDLGALDTAACRVIGIEPMSVPTTQAARRLKYSAEEKDIRYPLLRPEEVLVKDFKKVTHCKDIMRLLPLPKPVIKFFASQWAPRPQVSLDKCVRCFRCRSGCPVKPAAINPEAGAKVAKTCIRCYCCHEFCPADAIILKRSLLDRVFHFSALLNFLSRTLGRLISKFSI